MKTLFRKCKLVALVLVPVLLTGCSVPFLSKDSKDYPVLEVADYSDVKLDIAKTQEVQFSYPSEDWALMSSSPPTIVYMDFTDAYSTANIIVGISDDLGIDELTEDDLEDVVDEMAILAGGSFAQTSETGMRLFNGEPVIYMEQITTFTDELLDILIEQGSLDERAINAAGGREILLSHPPIRQIVIFMAKDHSCYACAGTFYTESQKQVVLDTMTIVLSTMEKR